MCIAYRKKYKLSYSKNGDWLLAVVAESYIAKSYVK